MTDQIRSHQFSDGKSEGFTVRKEQAHAIRRVLDRKSHKIVGWLYEWNTGQIAVLWKDRPCEDVIYA